MCRQHYNVRMRKLIKLIAYTTQIDYSKGNLGGICGVITGFSLISLVEIIYFIIRRMLLFIWNWCTKLTGHDETLKIMP